MNRRRFLETLLASGAAMVLDPERLLWVPEERTIFIPPTTNLIPVNLRITSYYGVWDDGLSGPEDFISYCSFGSLDLVSQLAYVKCLKFRNVLRRHEGWEPLEIPLGHES